MGFPSTIIVPASSAAYRTIKSSLEPDILVIAVAVTKPVVASLIELRLDAVAELDETVTEKVPVKLILSPELPSLFIKVIRLSTVPVMCVTAVASTLTLVALLIVFNCAAVQTAASAALIIIVKTASTLLLP